MKKEVHIREALTGWVVAIGNKWKISVLLTTLVLITSCQKHCPHIENNSYKGYGFFVFRNDFQDGYTELLFIPVCSDIENLLHFKNIETHTGLSFLCYGRDSLLRNLAKSSYIVPIDKETNYEQYLTPVYIDFIQVESSIEDVSRYPKTEETDHILLPKDTIIAHYYWTKNIIYNIIRIKQIKYYSFDPRSEPFPHPAPARL